MRHRLFSIAVDLSEIIFSGLKTVVLIHVRHFGSEVYCHLWVFTEIGEDMKQLFEYVPLLDLLDIATIAILPAICRPYQSQLPIARLQ